MAYLFEDIIARAPPGVTTDLQSRKSRDWFRNHTRNLRNFKTQTLFREGNATFVQRVVPGKLYLFKYEALGEGKLLYWDRFPLVWVFKRSKRSNSFLGLNMHYLPHRQRALLMNELYKLQDGNELDLNYRLLNSARKYRWFRPCVKRYLNKQVRSRYIRIDPNEWDLALMMPLAKWEGKESESPNEIVKDVYRDSLNAI